MDNVKLMADPKLRDRDPNLRFVQGALGPSSTFLSRKLWDGPTIAYLDFRNWKEVGFSWNEAIRIAEWFEKEVALSLRTTKIYLGYTCMDEGARIHYSPIKLASDEQLEWLKRQPFPLIVFRIEKIPETPRISSCLSYIGSMHRNAYDEWAWMLGIRSIRIDIIRTLVFTAVAEKMIWDTFVRDLSGADQKLEELFSLAVIYSLSECPQRKDATNYRRQLIQLLKIGQRVNGELHATRDRLSFAGRALLDLSFGSTSPTLELKCASEEFLREIFEKEPFLAFSSNRTLDYLYTTHLLNLNGGDDVI